MMMEEGEMTAMDMRDWANPVEDCDPRRRRRCIVTGLSVLVVVLVIVIATVAGKDGSPKYASVSEENMEYYEIIKSDMLALDMPTDDLLRIGSYQNKALNWLMESPDIEDYPYEQKIQRFALACFYYATSEVNTERNRNPGPWSDHSLWLTDNHECEWSGVICKTGTTVQSISLEHNNLSGKIPIELGLIWENLKILELSFNGITVEGDDWEVFTYLPHLEKIALSANYVVSSNGVPAQLKACKYLRKLLLSDNLISGPLDNGVLGDLQKLTHLEIEYNTLTGNTAVLAELSSLQQLYLRHNHLHSHLKFLKSENMSNLISIWLDGNDIVMTIPSEIGKLTELRSVSIADTKLTGTIPTEVGLLTELQRLWLYRNQLSGTVPSELELLTNIEMLHLEENDLEGTIPSQVCTTVGNSTYAKSAVSADCDKVDCECCTECF